MRKAQARASSSVPIGRLVAVVGIAVVEAAIPAVHRAMLDEMLLKREAIVATQVQAAVLDRG
ncbi:hypothetical protein [Ensifer sp.]|uniref:hypothetical protein n=1 Tax=Ensifer sp. TaxID=1872086 RepID=UPI0013AF94B1|nr:hypothetical protein [Ensifer sp.]